jgi:hypothetical protein
MRQFSWHYNEPQKRYTIYSNNKPVGDFETNNYTLNSFGNIDGIEYKFERKGCFSARTNIIDTSSDKIVGSINNNLLNLSANIQINNKTLKFHLKNLIAKKWVINSDNETLIEYTKNNDEGTIESKNKNGILLLSGLYLAHSIMQFDSEESLVFILLMFIIIFM